MSTNLPPPQRSWWQKSPTGEVFDKHSKGSGKFNTLASAIGLRPKKTQPPPLTILGDGTDQRRPNTAPSSAGLGMGRPPSSSSRSRVDSLEPKTPEDPRRGSLMTLSDMDPFAARVVAVRSPSDPNRLSAFSSSSESKSPVDAFQRISYASSSSQSFRLGSELSPLSATSDPGLSPHMMPGEKKSSSSLRRKDIVAADINRFSQPDPLPKPRPAMRARGMTDGGLERVPFLRSDSFTRSPPVVSPTSPSRKLSQRTAPPTSDLPMPPMASTSVAFPEVKPLSPRKPRPSQDSSLELEMQTSSRPRTLKKSMSQQSLNKHRSPSVSSTNTLAELTSANSGPRKQRSFHRLPVHAVPLQLPLSEQRAEPSPAGRKRLFSASSSRRPSESTLPLVDDVQPIYESDRTTLAASTSCWIDPDQPRTPTSTAYEYTPQQIMSPAEMLEVEARVEAEYHSRPRGGSIMSDEYSLSPSSPFGGDRKRSNSEHPSIRSDSMSPHDEDYLPEPPSPPVLMSLPPPPRRTKSRTSSVSSRSAPEIRASTYSSRSQPESYSSLSPPPRKISVRPKPAADRQRQSLYRKPSFLDINDEDEKEPLPPPPPLPVILKQDSFLDLTRESFDSNRSDDSF